MSTEMTPVSFDEYINHREMRVLDSELLLSDPFIVEFIPLDDIDFVRALSREGAVGLGSSSRTLALQVAKHADVETARHVANIPTQTQVHIELDADELRPVATVTGNEKGDSHKLSVLGDTAFLEGMTDIQIECAVKLYAVILGCEEFELPDEIISSLHGSYSNAQYHQARAYATTILPIVSSYIQGIEHDATISEVERSTRLAHVRTLRFQILDPTEFLLFEQLDMSELTSTTGKHVDTRYLNPDESSAGNAAATYNPKDHSCQFPLPRHAEGDPLLFEKVFHEIGHGESPHLITKTPEGRLRVKRVGFSVNAQNRSGTVSITMHHDLNEGVNDYFARLRMGEDPLSSDGFYPDKRLVVDALIDLTGHDVWERFYNASCTDNELLRRETYRDLSRTLDSIGGRGFLNRLATSWALYGDDYILDLIDSGAFDQLEFTKPLDLPAAYQNPEEEAEVIDDISELSVIVTREAIS